MARNVKNESTKTFGGNAVPAGKYIIADAIITDETLEITGQPTLNYDLLQVVLKNEAGTELETSLILCLIPPSEHRETTERSPHQLLATKSVQFLRTA